MSDDVTTDPNRSGFGFDVFISSAPQDQQWVNQLANDLKVAGLRVFQESQIIPGDVRVHAIEAGIAQSRCGILVFSPQSIDSAEVMQQYAALLERSVEVDRRFIPVLYQDVDLPEFAATRQPVDFRLAAGPAYSARLSDLIRALNDLPPEPTGASAADTYLVPAPRSARLTLTTERVSVFDRDSRSETEARPDAATLRRVPARLNDLHRLRHARGASITRGAAGTPAAAMRQTLQDIGHLLGEAFTPAPVADELTRLAGDARRRGSALRLGLDLAGDFADWPVETLIPAEPWSRLDPGQPKPLALTLPMQLYRILDADQPVPAITIPAPLRILVALASPEGSDGGALLDVERELAAIIDAVEPARHKARAYVRVLNTGTRTAIRDALKEQRFHVLHLCCHAAPGHLILETDQGRPDRVSADELIAAIPHDRRPAAVVLAGCSTALTSHATTDTSEALPGLARQLLTAGVPQVIAMTAPVTDRYAIRLAQQLYHELATAPEPHLVDALTHARHTVETSQLAAEQQTGSAAPPTEWATPVVLTRGEPLPLYDPADGAEPITEPPAPMLAADVPLRPVGDFVGRRAELSTLGAVLREPRSCGILVHGIGGVGKSSLVAELLRLLDHTRGLVVSVVGEAGPERILEAFARTLFTDALRRQAGDDDPHRRLSAYLRNPSEPWQERLITALTVLTGAPVTLLLDNFENNLQPQADGTGLLADDTLAEFLTAWIRTPGPHRLLITSRYPFLLPGNTQRRLTIHHLGPLSLAETRKLIWRLPALDNLTPEQQQRSWTDVGGHPRTLEYLDALLRMGQARFPDVTERLETLLTDQGITDPHQWISTLHKPAESDDLAPRDRFDRVLAEAVTLTVNDTLLHQLVDLLDPDTQTLLIGAAVYRSPADQLALAWQTATPDPTPDDPGRDQRLAQLNDALQAARRAGRPAGLDQLGYTTEQLTQLQTDLDTLRRPPLTTTTADPAALAVLSGLGLITPTPASQEDDLGEGLFVVHRWTATALARLYPQPTRQAHQHAAAYHAWRVDRRPQDPMADLHDRIEARYHHHSAGDLPAAIDLSYQIRDQLDGWSAWDWEKHICQETLTWIPTDSYDTAAFTHQLGNLAYLTSDYAEAERRYQQALTIAEELGDRAGTASGYHQLGMLAQDRGDYREAERRYQQALTIKEELGDRAGTAGSYHQLGNLAYLTSDYAEAERRYQQALTIVEELGDRASTARSYHQLGMLAQDRGDYGEAERRYQQAESIFEELGDRAGTASSYHQLGILAQRRGDYHEAERRYQQALTIFEELGDRASTARSYHQLGNLAYLTSDYAEAERRYQQALTIFEELGDRASTASSYHQLGMLAQARGDYSEAERRYQQSLTIKEELGDRAGAARSCHELGILAQARGDYSEAERRYQQSLTIKEELGDRAGTARSYHQLGMLAQDRGDYAEAERRYQQSLTILEELGDRAGTASSTSQLGILRTTTGQPERAVPLHCTALAIRLDLETPEAGIDLTELTRLRTTLGETVFRHAAATVLDDEAITALTQLLDQWRSRVT
ncbi:tetratricopeptide repeat protein [Actinoplanes bogorensis]|uniref:Tetratricopeptide repeat protein n=1 Tax=Paractinoplanes bogorensis TaxID=1610840 RepID=A0ABS5Z5L1_9ACTN|nr:tetratricopeptide repeat protein [Actinoplanes bogorensis]MBU2670976.1 tetratricopeptide repeat protein [Actinoplanes bogorensis]